MGRIMAPFMGFWGAIHTGWLYSGVCPFTGIPFTAIRAGTGLGAIGYIIGVLGELIIGE